MSVQTQIDRISGAVSSALSAIAEKGVTVPSGTKVDGLASLIAAIEAGGGGGGNNGITKFTFTPAETGLLTINMDFDETLLAIVWIRADDRVIDVNVSNKYESIAGITYIRKYSSNGTQAVMALRRTSSTTTFALEAKYYNSSLNGSSNSSANSYGAALLTWSSSKGYPDKLTFYVNADGSAGLNVGRSYNVYIIPLGVTY